MKKIFERTDFPEAPGGDIYDWEDAKTTFEVKEADQYVISITMSAENGKQNGTGDDADARVIIDGIELAMKEVHDKKESWKGFGTSVSWDGASLKGSSNTNHYFMELGKGKHVISFEADGKPVLKRIAVYQLTDLVFDLYDIMPTPSIKSDRKGIPLMGFYFQGAKPKRLLSETVSLSASQKEGFDDDNVKYIVNGKIVKNDIPECIERNKNFYDSGNLSLGKKRVLELGTDDFQYFENTFEIWYDEKPTLQHLRIELESINNERYESIIKDFPLEIVMLENPLADGTKPDHEDHSASGVQEYIDIIQEYSTQYEMDPDLVKAIMYLETTHGQYDRIGLGIFNETILPMNLNAVLWGKIEENGEPLNYSRDDLKNPGKNVHLGVLLLKRIKERLQDPTVEKVATVYNNLNALKISDYGARVKAICDERLFEKVKGISY